MDKIGVDVPHGELATFKGGLRGVISTDRISAGDLLCSYPRSATMDLSSVTECPCTDLVDAVFWDGIPEQWFVKLALWLVSEKRKGADSRWSEYIALLPSEMSTPFHWTDAQLDLLAYPPAVSAVREQRALFTDIHKRVTAAACAPLEPEELNHAMEMALSRAFDSYTPPPANLDLLGRLMGRGGTAPVPAGVLKAFVPFGDAFNHLSSEHPVFSYEPGNDRFSIVSDRNYSAGEQARPTAES
ncbi:hypothetical protein T484DRAFT_1777220 [Baffinella frigidus]|nr:hypothetical protein T484DRAFT_1777220 [Cryptophyta sp. CCMP2293]